MRFVLPVLCVMLFASLAHAQTPCAPTPALKTINYPGVANIPPGNNLLKPAGKGVIAAGQQLSIIGRLFDNRCIPIIGATVEIWQVDPFGKWILANSEDLVNANPVFAGAGRTYTDNGGQFYFTTAFPAPLKNRAPHINVRVKAKGMKDFDTVLYFRSDARNATDAVLKNVKNAEMVMLDMNRQGEQGYSGMITLVLPEKAPYRGY